MPAASHEASGLSRTGIVFSGDSECGTTLLSAASYALLPFFTTAEACALRLINKECCAVVSAFPFDDRVTAVPLAALPGWRACLPNARCLRLSPFQAGQPCTPWRPEYAPVLATLRELDMSHPNTGFVSPLAGDFNPDALLPGLLSSLPTTLASLSLRSTPTGSLLPTELARFTRLRSLDVSHTGLHLTTQALLAPLAGLRHLKLAGCKAAFAEGALAPLTQLLTLDVSHTRITDAALARLPALRTLLMHGCSRLTGQAFGACPQLEELGMANCTEVAATFTPATFAALPKLRVLRMSCTTMPQPLHLAPLAPSLQELDCCGCGPALVAVLGALFTGSPLRALNISLPDGMAMYYPLSAIRALEDARPTLLRLLAQLHKLDASYLLVSPDTLAAVAAESPCLRTLRLDCTQRQAPYYRDAQRKDAQPWSTPQGLGALLTFPHLRALQSNAAPLAAALTALPRAEQQQAMLLLLAEGERQRVEALVPVAGYSGRGIMAGAWHPRLYEKHDSLQMLCYQVRLEGLVQAGFPLPLLLLPQQNESALGLQGTVAEMRKGAAREEALQRLFSALCTARPSTPRAHHFRCLWAVGVPLAPPPAMLALARAQHFDFSELHAAALPLRSILASGLAPLAEVLASRLFTLPHLIRSGASMRSLVASGMMLPELLAAGAHPRTLYSPGFSSLFTLPELLGHGVAVEALAKLGASSRALGIAGVREEELLFAGFSEGEIRAGAALGAGERGRSSGRGRGGGGGGMGRGAGGGSGGSGGRG
jgi:hypothetical protein